MDGMSVCIAIDVLYNASMCAHAYLHAYVGWYIFVLFSDRTVVSQSSSDIPLE